jgi:hypothetical protein
MKQSFRSLTNFTLKHFALLSLLLKPSFVFAAACCGGGFASPSLIAGDHATQFTASTSLGEVVVDNVDGDGYWRRFENHTDLKTVRLEGATLLSDRFQAGFAVPIVSRSRLGQSFTGLGDLAATVGYEYLPDWDYNPIRPKGLGFLQITLPTGKSRFESENGGLDSRGNGFFALGAGTLLTKTFDNVDTFVSLEGHKGFSKSVNTSILTGKLSPGFGANFGGGAGYNTEHFRFGGSVTWTVEAPVHVDGLGTNFDSSVERYATAALSLSYLASEEWASTLSYIDQTWFGSPVNTSLARSVALQFQRRWSR